MLSLEKNASEESVRNALHVNILCSKL